MKTDKNILIAFILNLTFSILEFFGGTITNSIAIVSDAIHDLGDSLSIGLSYFLEKKSKKRPDDKYTFGYIRYSVLGSIITTTILLIGSIFVIYNAVQRIITPASINYDGMLILAIIGVIINFLAAFFTRKGVSLNQKAVNLHMLEDVFGWIIVLIGALLMKVTDIKILDPILSLIVALFILKDAWSNLKQVLDLFLEKTPDGISITDLKEDLLKIKGVKDVHHIHVWSIDGVNNFATMHIVTNGKNKDIKEMVKHELSHHKINHTTIEIENEKDHCDSLVCDIKNAHNNHTHKH